jgi:Ni/Co efflux regulator RcnB
MARMLLRRPLLVWTLVLLLVAHHAVARTLTSEGEGGKSESEKREDHRDEKREDHGEKSDKEKEHEKSPRCNKKNTYACEDGSNLSVATRRTRTMMCAQMGPPSAASTMRSWSTGR